MKRLVVVAALTLLAALPQSALAVPCTYTVTPSIPVVLAVKPTIGSINVTTGPTCSWTAFAESPLQFDNVLTYEFGTVTGSGSFPWANRGYAATDAHTVSISIAPVGQSAIVVPFLLRTSRNPSMYLLPEAGFLSRDLSAGTLHVQSLKTDGDCANCRTAPQTPWGANNGFPGEGSDPHPAFTLGPVGVFQSFYRRDPATGDDVIDLPRPAVGIGMPSVATIVLPALPNTDYIMAAIGEFDGNRRQDLVWRNPVTGAVALWIMDSQPNLEGQTLRTIVDLPSLPSNFVIGGAYDFNSDGIDDLLWRNTSNGNNAVWLMNPTTPGFLSVVDLPALPDPSFYIGALDDFDNDGQPDILWRNDATGELATWKMNNTTFVRIVDLDPLVGVSVLGPH
jgi:hypothetical protein